MTELKNVGHLVFVGLTITSETRCALLKCCDKMTSLMAKHSDRVTTVLYGHASGPAGRENRMIQSTCGLLSWSFPPLISGFCPVKDPETRDMEGLASVSWLCFKTFLTFYVVLVIVVQVQSCDVS